MIACDDTVKGCFDITSKVFEVADNLSLEAIVNFPSQNVDAPTPNPAKIQSAAPSPYNC